MTTDIAASLNRLESRVAFQERVIDELRTERDYLQVEVERLRGYADMLAYHDMRAMETPHCHDLGGEGGTA